MWRVAWKNLTGHKRRLAGTLTAVVLGVAFLAGTLVLSDTMRASFDSIFASANAGTDVIVQSSKSIGEGTRGQSGSLPDSLVTQLGQLPNVAAAEPNIQGIGQISGSDGKPIGGEGPPTLAGNWIENAGLNPYRIAEGAPPSSPGEIVIDAGAAANGDLSVGDKTTLRVPNPEPVTVVGIATFGNADSLGGTTYAGLTLADAQKFLGEPGRVSQILMQGNAGVSQDALLAEVQAVLPPNAEAITGEQLTAEQNQQIEDGFLGFFRTFLLVFAIIALIVASFSIYNTFAVIVAQRSRESALLRALGASRAQVMRSLTLESLIIGVMASVIGLGAGILLATGLKSLLDVIGFGLPPGGLTITAGTVAVSLTVGVLVTLFASVFPAIKASRIPPLAALRELSLDKSGTSPGRVTLGLIFMLFGLLILATLLIPSDYAILPRTATGATLTFLGYLIFSPVAAKPVGILLGAPIRWLRGVPGGMAQRNAIRNPRRTANTAAALMVGVAVVTLFTIFAASIKTSIDASVAGSFRGELVMSSSNFNGAGYSPEMIQEISEVPGVAALAALSQGTVLADGNQLNLTVANPAELGTLIDLPSTGQPVSTLTNDELAISRETASQNGFGVGNEVAISFADGITEKLTIGAIYDGEELVGNGIISPQIYGEHVRQITYNTILMSLVPGSDEAAVQGQIQAIADEYSAGDVQTREQFIQSTADQIDQLLNIVYVLLILAIIIALMGITNTLSLSIYERTRELGLLRAVGQTRGQTRSMVRWESVIIALFGTISGMVLGVVLGWALMRAVAAQEDVARFTLPVDQLVFVAIAGALVGVLAGLRPAARAAKLNILAAISSE